MEEVVFFKLPPPPSPVDVALKLSTLYWALDASFLLIQLMEILFKRKSQLLSHLFFFFTSFVTSLRYIRIYLSD